jgi:hypothetical protein
VYVCMYVCMHACMHACMSTPVIEANHSALSLAGTETYLNSIMTT